MGWFTPKDDPVALFKKELMQAIHEGDREKVAVLAKTERDIPPDIFSEALEKAVKNEQCEIVAALLPRARHLSMQTMRGVVWNGNMRLFRILAEAGFNFPESRYAHREDEDREYKTLVGLRLKTLECTYLEEKNRALKQEIAKLKNEMGIGPATEDRLPEPPKVKGLKL